MQTLFMIHTGRLEKCYQLSCAASRVLVALGGRSYSSFINTLRKEDVVGAKFCLTLCILYDKSLSLAMNRPSCLPDINLDASVITPLDPNRPFTAIAHIYLELALVQDGIIRGQTGMTEPRNMLDLVKNLQQKMWHIREKIRQVRLCPSDAPDRMLTPPRARHGIPESRMPICTASTSAPTSPTTRS
jgi:hypothetical protein